MNHRATRRLMPLFSPSANSTISSSLSCSAAAAALVSASTAERADTDADVDVDVDEPVKESSRRHHVKCRADDDDDHKRNDLPLNNLRHNEYDHKQSALNTNASTFPSLPFHSSSPAFPLPSSPTTTVAVSPSSSSSNFIHHRMIHVSNSLITSSSPLSSPSSSSPSSSSSSSSSSSPSMQPSSTSPSSSSYGPTYSVIAPSPPVSLRSCQAAPTTTAIATAIATTTTMPTTDAMYYTLHQPSAVQHQPQQAQIVNHHQQPHHHHHHRFSTKQTVIQNENGLTLSRLVTHTPFPSPSTAITSSTTSTSRTSKTDLRSPLPCSPASSSPPPPIPAARKDAFLAEMPPVCSYPSTSPETGPADDCRSATSPSSSSSSSSSSFSSSSCSSTTTVHSQMKGPLVDLSNWPLVRDDSVPVADLEWDTLDLTDPLHCQELFDFLANNYIDGEGAAFRYNYSVDMLKWALMPPGYRVEWMVCLREKRDSTTPASCSSSSSVTWQGACAHRRGRLAAVITAVPQTLRIMSSVVSAVFINFFCLSASYRAGGVVSSALIRRLIYLVRTLSPVTTVALYTSGSGSLVIAPTTTTTTTTVTTTTTTTTTTMTTTATAAVSTATFYHRPLNVRKLIHVGFSRRPAGCQTLEQSIAFYSVPADTSLLHAVVPLNESYLQAAALRFHHYMERFDLAPVYTVDEFRHYFMPRAGVVCTYVMPSPTSPSQVSDLLSFHLLPSRVLRPSHLPAAAASLHSTLNPNPTPNSNSMEYSEIRAAFLTYAIASSVPLSRWLNVGLLLASEQQLDVFNALDCMELDAARILEPIKFRKGTGNLFYHLFNWPHSHLIPKQKLAVLAI